VPSRIAFSTLAFPDATLAAAASAGRRWGYSGIELRLIDGELIDPAMPAARRAQVGRTLAAAGGYPHWISVECEKRWHPEIEPPEVALPQHLSLLASWLESGQ